MKILLQSKFQEPETSGALRDEPLIVHRHEGVHQSNTLIVFAHGLGGNRYGRKSTWGKFPEFVFEDFPALDIGIYEYQTLFRRWKFWESIPLKREAEVLAHVLREADAYDRIILAGHSMGGLLCMAAICYFFNSNQSERLERIAGLFLMATPQTGSQRVPRFLSWLSQDFYALRPHGPFVEDLQRTMTNSFNLDEEVQTRGNKTTIPTWAVVGASDFWVDRLSAGIRLSDERQLLARGSHTSIVKPKSKESESYSFFRKRLKTCLGRIENHRSVAERNLEALLFKFPPPRVSEVDPYDPLGVSMTEHVDRFREKKGARPPYIPREKADARNFRLGSRKRRAREEGCTKKQTAVQASRTHGPHRRNALRAASDI